MGLARCFAHFGAAGHNQRWSWSARTPDDKTVVLTIWKDLLDYSKQPGPVVYTDFASRNVGDWMNRPGNRERLENLIWARDHLDGVFKVVIVTARDTRADPREIADCYPVKWSMLVTEINETTGQFRAEVI